MKEKFRITEARQYHLLGILLHIRLSIPILVPSPQAILSLVSLHPSAPQSILHAASRAF